jgi:pilus assembly protein CpaE
MVWSEQNTEELNPSARTLSAWRPRPKVALGIHDLAFHQEVLDFLARDPGVEVIAAVAEAQPLRQVVCEAGSAVTVVCPQLLRDLVFPPGGPPFALVVTPEITVPVLRDAIDAGARGVFAWPEEREELRAAIARSCSAEPETAAARGTVIAAYGARGGAGTTFLASHLAASLADRGVRCAVADLDTAFAGLTVALGVAPEDGARTVADLVPVMAELAPDHLEDVLVRHPRGFGALLGPPANGAAPPPPSLVRAAIALLALSHEVLVLHLPRATDEVARTGVEMADRVVLVTTADLFSLFGARRAIDLLALGSRPDRWEVVLNHRTRGEPGPAEVARVLGKAPLGSIRFDPAVRRAQDRGQLLARRSRGAMRDVRAVADRLLAGDRTARRA